MRRSPGTGRADDEHVLAAMTLREDGGGWRHAGRDWTEVALLMAVLHRVSRPAAAWNVACNRAWRACEASGMEGAA